MANDGLVRFEIITKMVDLTSLKIINGGNEFGKYQYSGGSIIDD